MRLFLTITAIVTVILLILAGTGGYVLYRHYENRRVAQEEVSNAKAEDIKVTFIEGWKISEMAVAVEKAGLGSAASFTAAAKSLPSANTYIDVPTGQTLEGYLFPDTYRFAKDSTPEMIVEKMIDNFTTRVAKLGAPKGGKLYIVPGYEKLKLAENSGPGLTFHQLITLASILEKESGNGENDIDGSTERKIISGVFYNRLMIGQALESDATVNYVTGKDNPAPLNADLEANSPYNTYKYPGLPPGPIDNPSLSSIEAALNPQKTNYYYFLHDQSNGKVYFGRTYDEHLANKARYLK